MIDEQIYKSPSYISSWIGKTVCKKYTILSKLDSGSFGAVFLAKRKIPLDGQ